MMKTKKLLAAVISCLLLIGAAIGITVFAAGSPTASIAEANLSYEGATRILYKLDTANLGEGQTVKILFSFDSAVEAPTGVLNAENYDYVGTAFELDGGKAVYSPGFAPADMTKTVYAIPVVVDAEDNVLASGAKVGSSVYDYMMARFGGTYTPEQFLLYMSTLDFGGSVQAAIKETEGTEPADGYADAYYVLSVMDGAGNVTDYSYREPTDVSLKAPKGYDGRLFDSFVDNKGVKYGDADFNNYNFRLDKIGTTYVKFLYGDTEIGMESMKATADSSATLANPDTDVVVKGGAEYYFEADVELAEGTYAYLDFMADETVKIGTVSLYESEGEVVVNDRISNFTMANGSALRVEYVVISETANLGTLFYYVNNEFVAKTDIPVMTGTSNASYSSVVLTATSGEARLSYANVGAKDGFITFTTTSVSSVVYDYDPTYGKFFNYAKTSDAAVGGDLKFEINEAVDGNATTTLEAKVKLTSNFITAGTWRNFMDFQFQTDIIGTRRYNIISTGTARIAFTPTAFYWGGSATNGTAYSITNAIAAGEWFDLKIEHVGNKSYTIYINGEAVYTANSGTAAMDLLTIIPGENGMGSIQMADIRYTSK